MSYTTPSEIEADFKNIKFVSGSGNVTLEDVTQFIVEADAMINAYVGARYVVPVTAGDGLQMLKTLSRTIVTLRVRGILEVKQVTNSVANQNPVVTLMSMAQIMKMLQDIKAGTISVAGATALVLTGGTFFSSNKQNGVCPTIKKDETQWAALVMPVAAQDGFDITFLINFLKACGILLLLLVIVLLIGIFVYENFIRREGGE